MSTVILTDEPRSGSVLTHTRQGWDIPNGYVPDVRRWAGLEIENERYCGKWPKIELRKPHLLFYNCHGMTFASRRTCIDEPASVTRILLDDGYQDIEPEKVVPGDLVVYHSDTGDPEHSAVIISKPDKDPLGYLAIVVISKWGASGPEVVHRINECPYSFANLKFYRMMT